MTSLWSDIAIVSLCLYLGLSVPQHTGGRQGAFGSLMTMWILSIKFS